LRGYLLQTLSRVSGYTGYILQIKFYTFPRFQCFSVLITTMGDCMFSCFRTEMAAQQRPFFILTALFCYFREHKLTCPICALPDLLVSRLLLCTCSYILYPHVPYKATFNVSFCLGHSASGRIVFCFVFVLFFFAKLKIGKCLNNRFSRCILSNVQTVFGDPRHSSVAEMLGFVKPIEEVSSTLSSRV